ncbi:T9SS type A sorting domain-containing protein [bacterium]|nr:T9SS type A sorting domain-containing protein [bacterium]
MNVRIRVVLLCVAFSYASLLPKQLKAAVLNVPSEYRSIQTAVINSSPNDTIAIAPGVYNESITIFEHSLFIAGVNYLAGDTTQNSLVLLRGPQSFPISRAIRIHLNHSEQVTLAGLTIQDCYGLPSDSGTAIFSDGPSLRLDQVNIRNNQSGIGAVYIQGWETEAVLHSCTFDSNTTTFEVGALAAHVGRVFINMCTFRMNTSMNGAASIGSRTSNFRLQKSVFRRNDSGPLYGAVTLFDGDADTQEGQWIIEGNHFIENVSGVGACLQSHFLDTVHVRDNIFELNSAYRDDAAGAPGYGGALDLVGNDQVRVEGNKFIGNLADYCGAALAVSSDGIIANNQFIGNRAPNLPILIQYRVNGNTSKILFMSNLLRGNKEYLLPGGIRRYSMLMYPGNRGQLEIKECSFEANQGSVVKNGVDSWVIATHNYWGDSSGPFQPETNSAGQGDTLLDTSVPYLPFLRATTFLPSLSVQDTNCDFGALSLGEPASWEWEVINAGVDDLLISLQNQPRPGIWIDIPDTLSIDDLNTSHVSVVCQPREAGILTDTLIFETNDQDHPIIRLYIRAEIQTSSLAPEESMPIKFDVSPVFPNPFNPTATVMVTMPSAGPLLLEAFDLLGRRVALLHHGRSSPGQHRFVFDGSLLPSGLYFIRATTPTDGDRIQKVMLVK